ncbi:unnamed protein product [Amoebophrya sp. A120]|nr:unnamed protein product [Amoebophrya sp. A120]|eukprot:GSA120T00011678001.1
MDSFLERALEEEQNALKDFFPPEEHSRRLSGAMFAARPSKASAVGHYLRNSSNLDGGVDAQTGMKLGSLLTDPAGNYIPVDPTGGACPNAAALFATGVPDTELEEMRHMIDVMNDTLSTVRTMLADSHPEARENVRQRREQERREVENYLYEFETAAAVVRSYATNTTETRMREDALRMNATLSTALQNRQSATVPTAMTASTTMAPPRETKPTYEIARSMETVLGLMRPEHKPDTASMVPATAEITHDDVMHRCMAHDLTSAHDDVHEKCEEEWRAMVEMERGVVDRITEDALQASLAPLRGEIHWDVPIPHEEQCVPMPNDYSGSEMAITPGFRRNLQVLHKKTKGNSKQRKLLENQMEGKDLFHAAHVGKLRDQRRVLFDTPLSEEAKRKLSVTVGGLAGGSMLPAGESTTGCMPISGESQLQMTMGYDGPGSSMPADREAAFHEFGAGNKEKQEAASLAANIAAQVTIAMHDPAGHLMTEWHEDPMMEYTAMASTDPYANSAAAGFVPMSDYGFRQRSRARALAQKEKSKQKSSTRKLLAGDSKLAKMLRNRRLDHDMSAVGSSPSPYDMQYDPNSAMQPSLSPSSMAPGMNSYQMDFPSTMGPNEKNAVMNMYFGDSKATLPPSTADPSATTPPPPTTGAPVHVDFGFQPALFQSTSAPLSQDALSTTFTTSTTQTATPHWLLGWDYRFDYMWDDAVQMSIEKLVYTGTNATLASLYPADTDFDLAMTAETMEAGLHEMEAARHAEPAAAMNDTVMGVFDAQLAYEGDLHVPSFIPPNYDCWQHGTSNFVEQCYDEYSGYYSVQKDFGAICEHRKWVQSKAMEVADLIHKVIDTKAYTEAHSGLQRRVRRMLKQKSGPTTSIPTYVRKLLKLPQEWEEDASRRLSSFAMGPEAMMYDKMQTPAAALTGQSPTEDLPSNMPPDSMYNMMTPNETDQLDSPADVAAMLVGLEDTMDSTFVAAVEKMITSFERKKLDIYFEARAKPHYMQTLLNLGLNQTEKVQLMRSVQEIQYAEEPGSCRPMAGSMAMMQSGGCHSLWDEQLGCANLRWIATSWDPVTYAETFNNDWSMPHNKCENKKRELRGMAVGGTNKESAPMLEAMSQLLQRIGDPDYPNTGFAELMWKSGQRKPLSASETTALHGICDHVYEGTSGWGVKTDCRYDDCGNSLGCGWTKRGQREVKNILQCPGQVPSAPGTCGAQLGGSFYCATAKADFVANCRNVLDFLVETMPAEDGMDPVTGNYLGGYVAEQMRMALLFEIDPKFQYPYDPEPADAAGSRLARCALQAIRENLPEQPLMMLHGMMEAGEVSPADAMSRVLKPKLDTFCNATSQVSEAVAQVANMTDNCKEFCMTLKAWEETSYQLSCAARPAKPVFAEAFAYGSGAETCRPDVECKLFNEMVPVAEKTGIMNKKVAAGRLRERRQRRLAIEDRRRLMEESGESKQKCVKIDSVDYCSKAGSLSVEEAEKRRQLEYWEERGVDAIATPSNPAKASRLSKFKTNRNKLRKQRRLQGRR